MNPSRSSERRAEALVQALNDAAARVAGQVIPVEEWDWDEIGRLEDAARMKLRALPRCEECGNPMVCGQTRAHHTCRPQPPPPPKKRKLASK